MNQNTAFFAARGMDPIDESYPSPWWHHDDAQLTAPPFSRYDVVPETPPQTNRPSQNAEPPNSDDTAPIPFPRDEDLAILAAEELPAHSESAAEYLGVRKSGNTLRANNAAMKAVTKFISLNFPFCSASPATKNSKQEDWEKCFHEAVGIAKEILFSDSNSSVFPNGYKEWTPAQLKRIRFFLIEFAVKYRSEKSKSAVKPSTMKGYILGIQRFFSHESGYKLSFLDGPIFNCPKEGLLAVLDNRFSEQKSRGALTESHKTPSEEDLCLLYAPPHLSRDTAQGFQARLVFSMGLILHLFVQLHQRNLQLAS